MKGLPLSIRVLVASSDQSGNTHIARRTVILLITRVLHPERKAIKNWSASDRKSMAANANSNNDASMNEEMKKKAADEIKNLQAYLGSLW